MIRHLLQSYLFLLNPYLKFVFKKQQLDLGIDIAASSGGQDMNFENRKTSRRGQQVSGQKI